ncbi:MULTISPECIES: hypothetical protein [Halomicrobium]|uniref:Uncharacterized protein n=1 Tax=Halomicrobium mukohataei (strain ATCC 700874 / DSM 12286 / JCM 9738 / NCIMB 13541) TaxID=485914 RepID=C7P414_HALMD|nr:MULTISPECIES: hypothetical protein [Halomicrobium]ACV47836.1 conserved hypothetical protein [Halomicrobium mukohataei DSM 12286]
MRTQITLQGTDSQDFEQLRETIEQQRPGGRPSNAEVVRVLMDAAPY